MGGKGEVAGGVGGCRLLNRQGWAIALFFAKKSEKKSERAIRSFCALSLFVALFKREKERFALFCSF